MGKSKNKTRELFDKYYMGTRATDWLIYIYLAAVFGIYTIITNNAYFDITITRYKFISTVTYIFIIMFIIVIVLEKLVEFALFDEIKSKNKIRVRKENFWRRPDFWAMAFLISNVFAYIVSIDQKASMTGENGRYMGCMTYIFLCTMFIAIAYRLKPTSFVFYVLGVASGFAYIVAILQHAGVDFMGYKDNIAKSNYNIFTSTFGNINVFASFICISLPVFMGIYIYDKNKISKAFMAMLILLGGMSIIISNSDSVYLGIMAATCIIFFIAIYNQKIKGFVETIIYILMGNLAVVILRAVVDCEYDKKRGGVAEIIDTPYIAIGLLMLAVIIYAAVICIGKKYRESINKLNKEKMIKGIILTGVIAFLIVIIVGVNLKLSIFQFDYKWGTYRGYIWTKCVEIFKDAPLTNKIFGYGNETLRVLTRMHCYEEMIEITGKTYDNAHNELLQYLVTTGMAGMISYAGMFISGVVYMIKNMKKNMLICACVASSCGYFVQGLININQPITTPLFFVVMAIGVGITRYNEARV